eukprot:COSAG02_NODE_12483_length_1538_cov_11.364081_3_plen_75_part_00
MSQANDVHVAFSDEKFLFRAREEEKAVDEAMVGEGAKEAVARVEMVRSQYRAVNTWTEIICNRTSSVIASGSRA